MIETLTDGGKTLAKTKDLKEWIGNKKEITISGMDRLRTKIAKLGEFKPLVVTQDGEVLGGNHRLRVYKEMHRDWVWVSVVNPESEAEKLEYNLADNDNDAYYLEADLKSYLKNFEDEIQMDLYGADFEESKLLSELEASIEEVTPEEEPASKEDNFRLIVQCTSQEEQEKLWLKLDGMGFKVIKK